MSLYSALLISFSLLDLLCIITVIFFERKSPASTLAWILVLVFVPVVGFIAYIMFGSGFHVNKKKKYAVKAVTDSIYKNFVLHYVDVPSDSDTPENMTCTRMIKYLENDGGYFYTQDNDVEIFLDGNAMFSRMKEDIRQAQKHIHLLYYIFRNDSLGRELIALLTEKARSGVAVRVIYDSLGSMLAFDHKMFKALREAGGEIEAFSPVFFTLSSHLRLNYRNHRKITVIDGSVGYVGGMNVGKEYLGQHKKLHPWRDTHLRLTGSSVNFLQERFLMDWIYASDTEVPPDALEQFFSRPKPHTTLGVQIVSSGPDTKSNAIKNGLLEILYAARKNVFIQTPYFTPDESFIDALRIVARSGVDVRLMIPGLSDNFFVHTATYSYALQLLDAGIKIYMYKGFLHAKTMVFDGEAASIGTANLGNRSFALNFEVNAFIYDKNFAARYEQIFLQDQEHCTELSDKWFAGRHPLIRATYGLSRLLAPLM